MAEKNKTDWSRTQSARPAQAAPGSNEPQSPIQPGQLVATGTGAHSNAPAGLAVNVPQLEQPEGIIARWKTNALTRKATLQLLEVAYNGRLEQLKIRLAAAIRVEKAVVDVLAKEYLQQLDCEHLKNLQELNVKNLETRQQVMIDLNNVTAAKLKEAQEADWPPEMMNRTINHIFELHERAMAKIMKEVGEEKD